MPTTPATAHMAAEQFLELVLADEQLLQEEFDAIVAEEWDPQPPLTRPGSDAPATGPRPHDPSAPRGRGLRATRLSHPGAGGWRRQRSPPTPSATTATHATTASKGRVTSSSKYPQRMEQSAHKRSPGPCSCHRA